MHLGEWFAKRRDAGERGLRRKLADEANVSINTVNGWAQGWVMPRPDKVRFIETFTGGEVTSADLHGGYRGPRESKRAELAA